MTKELTEREQFEAACEELPADNVPGVLLNSFRELQWEGWLAASKFKAEEARAAVPREPVAWLYTLWFGDEATRQTPSMDRYRMSEGLSPFGRTGIDHGGEVEEQPLYTTPPVLHRALSDEEIKDYYQRFGTGRLEGFTAAIRAILSAANQPDE